jgi:hypothetical protein
MLGFLRYRKIQFAFTYLNYGLYCCTVGLKYQITLRLQLQTDVSTYLPTRASDTPPRFLGFGTDEFVSQYG